jgi:Ca2+-binding RTX toxin-like protein
VNAGVAGAFSGIEEIVGSGNAGDGLAGYASATTFTLAGGLAGVASGTDVPTVSFSGFETLAGGPSINELVASGAGMTFNVTGTNAGNVTGDVAFTGIGSLAGAAGNDSFVFGSSGQLTGSLAGGTGTNTLKGGAGTDTATYQGALAGVSVSLALTSAQVTGQSTDLLESIENLTGSAFDDQLTGDTNANVLDGAVGNDTLTAGAGDDTLVGGLGNDQLDGGEGTDTASFAASATAVSVSLEAGTVTGEGSDTLASIENIVGSAFNDTLSGGLDSLVLNSVLDGGAGNDSVLGGGGEQLT